MLLDALAHPAASSTWLLVAGDPGAERAALEGEIEGRSLGNRVRTDLRYIPNDEVGAYFEAADAVVLPYEVASESGALRAAIAHRRPVVATAVGGLAAAIADGRTGFLASPGDAGSLAEALRRTFDAGAEGRRRIAEAALREAEARSGWNTVAAATRALYDELLTVTGR